MPVQNGKTLKVHGTDFNEFEEIQIKLAKAKKEIVTKLDLFSKLVELGNKHYEELKNIK